MGRSKSFGQADEGVAENFLARKRYEKALQCLRPGKVICDLGCGYYAPFLRDERTASSFRMSVGLDLSACPSIAGVELVGCDINAGFPIKSDSIDVLSSLANLEHVQDPFHYASECFRVLRKNGLLICTTPSTLSKPILEGLSLLRLVSRREIQDHKNYFRRSALINLFGQAGFAERKISHEYFQAGLNNLITAEK